MLSVKVSTKHQIVVPSAVRRQLGIKAGDRLEVSVEDGDVRLHPRPARTSERMRGMFRGMYDGKDAVDFVRELREESERWRETDR
ncbi:MAG: AbrB/MazE/SpoVT family DNA-binding domain-containing protein [Candidatus Limnocylindrales bacterium]